MIQAFFNGLSGLFTFSKGLRNVSGNVSNMNTPGYRATDTFFRNVGASDAQPLGVEIADTGLRTTPGELRQSGNGTDMAINGRGLFVLQDANGDAYYTRAGQFRLNDSYQFEDAASGYRVMALGPGDTLAPIDLSGQRMLPPVPTANIDFTGNLVLSASTHTVNNVQVYDTLGQQLTLTVRFTNAAPAQPNTWTVEVTNTTLGTLGSGTLVFNGDGTPATGFNTVTVPLTSNGNTQTLTLNFGTPGTTTGTTQYSGATSTIAASVKDGSALSGLSTVTVNEQGVLQLTYANGKKVDGPQVALAFFADETRLVQNSKALLTSQGVTPQTGAAGSGAFGRIQGGYIELSNVDLAQEFGDLIIIQRGYQASSRVMTVASEMIEQLYNNSRSNG